MRTKAEIETEIAALKALKPVGLHAPKTAASIALQIEALAHGVDQTAEEWNELTEAQQSVVNDTLDWKEGRNANRPHKEWVGLVAASGA